MMSVDIRGFTGVTRFLMQLFYPRHLFCLLGYLDSIPDQQIPVVDGYKRAVGQDDTVPFFQNLTEFPGGSPEKGHKGRVKRRFQGQPPDHGAYPMLIESDHKTHDYDGKPVEGGLTSKAAFEFLEYAADLVYHDSPLLNDLVS